MGSDHYLVTEVGLQWGVEGLLKWVGLKQRIVDEYRTPVEQQKNYYLSNNCIYKL